jgi:hypothetical protein
MHKIALFDEEFGEPAVDLMRRLKAAWDPLNILNPGKVVTTTSPPASGYSVGHEEPLRQGCRADD